MPVGVADPRAVPARRAETPRFLIESRQGPWAIPLVSLHYSYYTIRISPSVPRTTEDTTRRFGARRKPHRPRALPVMRHHRYRETQAAAARMSELFPPTPFALLR